MELNDKTGNESNPCSIRVKFIRGNDIKYISHLDIMRVFQRVLRRSRIPISYSEGFNPQPHIVFGLPLAVGVTSEAEYADFQLDEYMEPDIFILRLNNELPPGLKVCEGKIKRNKDNIMAKISLASYKIYVYSSLVLGINEVRQKVDEFSKLKTITVVKQGKNDKKATGNMDIRPMIYKLEAERFFNKHCVNAGVYVHDNSKQVEEEAGGFVISALVSAGSMANLKPVTLVTALNIHMAADFRVAHVHRAGLFVRDGRSIIEPLHPRALGY